MGKVFRKKFQRSNNETYSKYLKIFNMKIVGTALLFSVWTLGGLAQDGGDGKSPENTLLWKISVAGFRFSNTYLDRAR